MKIGDTGRCKICGAKTIIIKDPTLISLTAGLWVHKSALRRTFSLHVVVPA